MRSALRTLPIALSCLLPVPLAFAGDAPLSIRTLAPEKSFLVAGIDDVAASVKRLEASPLGAWWRSEPVRAKTAEWRDNLEKEIERYTQELGIARESVCWPASAGLAVASELDEETGLEMPVLVLFLDWGGEAERFGAWYDAQMAKVEKEPPASFAIDEIRGRRVYVFPVGDPADADDMGMGGFDDPVSIDRLLVTRDGGRLLVSSRAATLEDLLGVLDGDPRKGVGETRDFRDALELVGGNPDAYAALLTAPLQPLVAALGGFQFALIQPFLGKLFGDVRAWSFALDFEDEAGAPALTQHAGILVPAGKVGLLSLFAESGLEKVPSLVPADAMSYGRLNLKFADLMRVLNDVVANLPEMQAEQIQPMLEQFEPMIAPSLAAMGPGLHTYGTVRQPITPESLRTTTVIPLTDAKAAQGLLAMFGPQAGLMPRDFLGNTVWSSDDLEVAVGYGQTHMFLGAEDDVEAALRALGQPVDGAGLEGVAKYRDAIGHLAKDGLVGYGWVDLIAMLEAQDAMFDQVMAGNVPGLGGLDPSQLADFASEIDWRKGMPELKDVLKAEYLKEFLGSAVWQMRSVPSGFRLESMTLPATGGAKAPAKDR